MTTATNTVGNYLIRPATALELGSLLQVERAAQLHPWSEYQLLQSLRDDVVLVLQCDVQIVAWCVIQIVLDEASLLNVAVLPAFRRRGIARQLLEHAFADARQRGCSRCFLEVRAGNVSAIALYRQMGFVFDGVRRGYYPGVENPVADDLQGGSREDAHLFHADW